MRHFSPVYLVSLSLLVLVATGPSAVQGQFFRDFFSNVGRGVGNFFRPVMDMFHAMPNPFRGLGPNRGKPELDETGGTKKPQATGIDKTYPDDCGRDPEKKTGLLCFPDGKLCEQSENAFIITN